MKDIRLVTERQCLISKSVSFPSLSLTTAVMIVSSSNAYLFTKHLYLTFPVAQTVKNPPANAGDLGLIPGLGRCPGEENCNPLQYPCLLNSTDRGAWQATVHGVEKSWT